MQLPQEAIEEFKVLYEREYKVTLGDEESKKLAVNLFDFFGAIAKPIDKRILKNMRAKKGV